MGHLGPIENGKQLAISLHATILLVLLSYTKLSVAHPPRSLACTAKWIMTRPSSLLTLAPEHSISFQVQSMAP